MLGYASPMSDERRGPEAGHEAASPSTATGTPTVRPPIDAICPYLLASDGSWRSATAAREHRCTAVSPPAPLAAEKQRRLCLTATHTGCATFVAAQEARAATHQAVALRRPITRSTPVVLDQGRLGVAIPSISTTPSLGQGVLIAVLAVAFGAIILAKIATGGVSGGVSTSPSPVASSSARAVVSASPSATPTATPKPTLVPSGSASPSPTVKASPTPTPSATPKPKTYKVKSGDTLSGIAAKFGTTVKALEKLNGITDPKSLHVGQILKLP
jgi:LysM repeat protein